MNTNQLFKTACPIIAIAFAFLSACQSDEYPETFHYPQGDQDFSQAEVDTEIEAEPEIENECIPDEHRCADEKTVERCDISGQWDFDKECADNEFCFEGVCVGNGDCGDLDLGDQCCLGSYRCLDEMTVEVCRASGSLWRWEFYRSCGHSKSCDEGVCELSAGEDCTVEEGCSHPRQYCLQNHPYFDEGRCAPYCDLEDVACPPGYQCNDTMCEPLPGYCLDDSWCEMDELCNKPEDEESGLCRRYCLVDYGVPCPRGTVCVDDRDSPEYGMCVPYCFEPGRECGEERFCMDDRDSPEYGMCVPYCFEPGRRCGLEEICVDDPYSPYYGQCMHYDSHCVECESDLDCDNSILFCRIDPRESVGCCANNPCLYCPWDIYCTPRDGCTPDWLCPACQPGYCCDATSAPNCYPCEGCVNPVICGILLSPCCPGYSCSAVIYGVYGYCI